MKAKYKMLALLIILIIAFIANSGKLSAQQNNISFQVFYDQLSPYGQWVDNPDYGSVWIPDAGPDFAPYSTRGSWIMTNYGWTWLSDYSWGWAPFHYGRWSYEDSVGWFWVPDYEWGPAWVNWRGSEGYYGWAPMEPGVSISAGFGGGYNSPYNHWNFVSYRNFGRSNINRYYVSHDDHDRIFSNSRIINNTYIDNNRHTTYVTGPSREDVQRVSGRKVRPVAIQESNVPEQKVRNGNLHIYRPEGTVNRTAGQNNDNRIQQQSNSAPPPESRPNFNNTTRSNNSINSINNLRSNSNSNNFNNNVKSNSANPDTKARSVQQHDAVESRRTVTNKQPVTPGQSEKSTRQSQRRARSAEKN